MWLLISFKLRLLKKWGFWSLPCWWWGFCLTWDPVSISLKQPVVVDVEDVCSGTAWSKIAWLIAKVAPLFPPCSSKPIRSPRLTSKTLSVWGFVSRFTVNYLLCGRPDFIFSYGYLVWQLLPPPPFQRSQAVALVWDSILHPDLWLSFWTVTSLIDLLWLVFCVQVYVCDARVFAHTHACARVCRDHKSMLC